MEESAREPYGEDDSNYSERRREGVYAKPNHHRQDAAEFLKTKMQCSPQTDNILLRPYLIHTTYQTYKNRKPNDSPENQSPPHLRQNKRNHIRHERRVRIL